MSRVFTAGNYFGLADASVLSLPVGPPGITFATWVKFNVTGVTGTSRQVYGYRDESGDPKTRFLCRTAWFRSIWTQGVDPTFTVRTTPGADPGITLPEGEWVPLVVSYRFEPAENKYLARVRYAAYDYPLTITGGDVYLHGVVAPAMGIGAQHDGTTTLNGKLAHFTIYGRGLTDEEIDSYLAGVNPLSIDGAVHYWPMLDGTGDITDTVNSITVPMVGTVGTDAADNPPVEIIGGPAVPDLLLSLSPAADGNQRISDPTGALPPALPTVPQAPESLSVDDVAANYVTVSWEYKGTTHTGFKTQYRLPAQGGVWLDGDTLKISDRTWTRFDLPPDTSVDVRILAFNAVGNSAPADISTVTGPPNTETNLDKIFIYTNLGDVPVGVRWDDYVPFNTSVTWGSDAVEALTAGRVCSNDIRAGTDGYGRWGFTFERALSAREGDEIWFRVYYLMPVGYDHYATGDALKWFRQGCNQIDGGFNTGTNGISFDLKQYSRWNSYKEQATDGLPFWQPMATFDQSTLYDDGKWHCYESYVKFSKDPAIGRQRFWVDGVLMGDVPRASLTDPEKNGTAAKGPYHCNRLYFQTWWNQNSDRDRVAYFDNIAIAMNIAAPGNPVRRDGQWLEVDANGFPFIGSKVQ